MELRHQPRPSFSGFTSGEVEKMESLLKDGDEQSFDSAFCKKLARAFNHSKGRVGKPVVKWTEVQNWFQAKQLTDVSEEREAETAQILRTVMEACSLIENNGNRKRAKGKKVLKLPKMEFEAKSLKDGAWYDVDRFLAHKHLDSGDAEVLVRFDGFKKDQDEWVNIKNAVRQRSITLEDTECHLVQAGETALCFQEQKDEARYFEVKITHIQPRVHDVRGCRCLFTIQYIHDNVKEKVQLKRLCFRPSILDS